MIYIDCRGEHQCTRSLSRQLMNKGARRAFEFIRLIWSNAFAGRRRGLDGVTTG